MTTITGRARRQISLDMFADLTPTAFRPSWQAGQVTLTFDAALDQATADKVRSRLESRCEVDETLRQQAKDALATDRTFINTTSGQLLTGADAIIANTASSQQEKDLAKAVKALTNQCVSLSQQNVKLIRQVLGLLDGTD